MTTPLSDERIAELRERSARARFSATPQPMETIEVWWQHVGSLLEIHDWYCADVPDLLSEVDRLRAMVRDFNTALVAKQEEMDSLTSHYVEIRDENQTLRYNYYGLRDTVFHLRARVARLEGVLREVEWAARDADDDGKPIETCPACRWWKTQGHHPQCDLDAVLRDAHD